MKSINNLYKLTTKYLLFFLFFIFATNLFATYVNSFVVSFPAEQQNPNKSKQQKPRTTKQPKTKTQEISEDSLKKLTYIKDSTAKLQYYKFYRDYSPFITFKDQFFNIPLTYKKNPYNREISLDSTGKFVIIEDKIGGTLYRPGLVLPIEDYINYNLAFNNRLLWEQLVRRYEGKLLVEDELKSFMSTFTNIDIPLPNLGILSIFGRPGIKLRINGAVDIRAAFRNEEMGGITNNIYGKSRNEPDFKQQVQINVDGTIGDKLKINADWNTERTFEYENRLKIKYTGYEDEIVQNVEAGNVSMGGSGLVSGSEALFGIKADMKFGPLSLSTIASQKKGETKEKSISGGGQARDIIVKLNEYSTNHYFIDTIYASQLPEFNMFNKYFSKPVGEIVDPYVVVEIEVWKSTTNFLNPQRRKANAYYFLPPKVGNNYDEFKSQADPTSSSDPEKRGITGYFLKLEPGKDYIIHRETGFISFKTQIQDNEKIAVAYTIQGNDPTDPRDDIQYGEFANDNPDTTLILKLIKPENLTPADPIGWKLMLKNIYPTKTSNVKEAGFEFDIKYQPSGSEPVNELTGKDGQSKKLLDVFGLDKYSGDNEGPDGKFDFKVGKTIITQTGEIIFPVLEPFGKNFPKELNDTLRFDELYELQAYRAAEKNEKNRFFFAIKATGDISSTIPIGFNVVENSVKVFFNGQELVPGKDYEVDYYAGQLYIKKPEALVPGADLKIKYEENDLAALASKSLVGMRGIFDFDEKTKLGFTVMNYSQQTLSDKVKIGDEPINNTMFGIDFRWGTDIPILTKYLNKVFDVRGMSSLNVTAEYARINPDGNTIKSTIEGDRKKSIAYIDDFEGGKRTISVGITSTTWKDLSVPYFAAPNKMELMKYKAKTVWFNLIPSPVDVRDIWPEKETAREDRNVPVLDLWYIPYMKGFYNYTPSPELPKKNWGGIMKYLPFPAKLEQENVEYIEFWFKPMNYHYRDTNFATSKIYIDIGQVSEDVIPNGKLDTEDKKRNGILDPKFDLGLDGLTDEEERKLYGSNESDPAGDNFFFDGRNYLQYNATQVNGNLAELLNIPDTEDLNGDGDVNLSENFYRYEIPLDTNRANNPYIQGGGQGNKNWYLIRVPIRDNNRKAFGNPDLQNVQYVRVFFENETTPIVLRITDFNFVGSQWQKVVKKDSTYFIGVINLYDNPEYTMPPGLKQEIDYTSTSERIRKNEQSLLLRIKEIYAGQKKETIKYLYQPLDIFNYSEMKLFIHGDLYRSTDPTSLTYPKNAYVYLRFGTDTLNYYEYRMPVEENWHDMQIKLDKIRAIKQVKDSLNKSNLYPVDGKPNHFYSFKGNPNLTGIKFFLIGVISPADSAVQGVKINGDIWIDELRVIDIDNTPGWSYRTSISLRLSDLMDVSFNYNRTNPNFRGLTSRVMNSASRNDINSWSVNTNIDILKVLPINLPESNLKLAYSHSESKGNPMFVPGTDIKVEDAMQQTQKNLIQQGYSPEEARKQAEIIKENAKNISVSDMYNLSGIRFKIPTTFWLIDRTINATTFNFNYNKNFSRGPVVEKSNSWNWAASINYNTIFPASNYIALKNIFLIGELFKIFSDYQNVRIYYTPVNFTFQITANRNYSYSINRKVNNTNPQPTESAQFVTSRTANFDWKLTEYGFFNLGFRYNVSINSTLNHLVDPRFERLSENEIWNRIFKKDFFGTDLNYTQSTDLRTNLRLPQFLNKYLTTSFGYSANYAWQYQPLNKELGRSASVSSRISSNMSIRYKLLMSDIFGDPTKTSNVNQNDTSKSAIIALRNFSTGLGSLLFSLLCNYDNISANYSLSNTFTATGLLGKGHGFENFWGIKQNPVNGPSRSFMLGFNYDLGKRAPNGANLTDNFSQTNSLDFRTNRMLFENVNLELNWRTSWAFNKVTTFKTNSNSDVAITNISTSGTLQRSFLTIPPVGPFKIFKSGIDYVREEYKESSDSRESLQNLSEAFVKGFESFPILSKFGLKDISKYLPRANWRISWSGLERIFIFNSFAQRVSLNHAYNSSYNEAWRITPQDFKEISSQKVNYGFAPLAELDITFNKLWNGNLNGRVRYNTNTSYDLSVNSRNITESNSREVGVTLSYNKSGFNLPFLGLNLRNDLDFSFSFSRATNEAVVYDFGPGKKNSPGVQQDGSIRTTLEPRATYKVSTMVTVSIFYSRSKNEPKGSSRVQPITTNTAGLDIHIAIQ